VVVNVLEGKKVEEVIEGEEGKEEEIVFCSLKNLFNLYHIYNL